MAISHVLISKSITGATAVWRQRTLAAHPDDKRNTRASELLELISAEPTSGIPADVVAKLDGYSDSEFNRVAMLVSRQVGFRFFPGTLLAFIQEVMARIDESRAEIDAAFPSANREAAR